MEVAEPGEKITTNNNSNIESQSKPTPRRGRRRYSRALTKRGPIQPDHLREMAVRILEFVRASGGTISLRELKRKMNAYRYPGLWEQGFARVRKGGQLSVLGRKSVFTLLKRPMELRADPVPRRKKRRRRARRPQTDWFKQRLPEFFERDGYDEKAQQAREALAGSAMPGHHANYAIPKGEGQNHAGGWWAR
jgi:hypothetical protein